MYIKTMSHRSDHVGTGWTITARHQFTHTYMSELHINLYVHPDIPRLGHFDHGLNKTTEPLATHVFEGPLVSAAAFNEVLKDFERQARVALRRHRDLLVGSVGCDELTDCDGGVL